MATDEPLIARCRRLWKQFVVQSFLAGAILFVLVLILGKEKLAAISAISASTFIVFTLPHTQSARAKNLIGGHLIGLVAGTVICITGLGALAEYPLAVAMACLIMVSIDMVHPPAAGTALSMVRNQGSTNVFVGVLVGVVLLSVCHYLLRGRMKNLI